MFEGINASRTALQEKAIPITVIAETPLQVKHTPARLAHDILMHNDSSKYSQCAIIGLPGSGKTTFVSCLLHSLHTKDDSYDVHHFKKEDILDLDKILDKLPKRKNCIIVFDDVSYLFERLGSAKIAEILHSLTIIREKLDPEYKQTKCIVFLLFHYSYALVKGLRTTNFRVMCSVSDEELENYRKVLGYHNSKAIYEFTKKYMSMMRYKKFKVKSNGDEPFVYHTDKPFRLALVSNMGELHYTLYHKAGCAKCLPHTIKAQVQPSVSFWDELLRKYGYNKVSSALAVYAFVSTHRATVTKDFRAIWNHIEGEYRLGHIDLLQFVQAFKEAKKLKADTMSEQFQKRHAFIIDKLKDMESKALAGEKRVVVDSLENVPPEALEGNEDNINIEYREDDEENDDDDNLEADLDSDERAMRGGGE